MAKKTVNASDVRISPRELKEHGVKYVLDKVRRSKGYFMTNTERDLSQSDFKNRVMPHTQMLVAEERNACGYFSVEISGGASIHVDMLRKQINPFEKLRVLKSMMPDTLFQTLCRGINLFGYRPYPDNVIRLTMKHFAEVIDVVRVFDFLNYVPNMIPVFEEVKRANRILEPSICFSTGPEHTDAYYVNKVREILDVTGDDIILCIKNHGGLGNAETDRRSGEGHSRQVPRPDPPLPRSQHRRQRYRPHRRGRPPRRQNRQRRRSRLYGILRSAAAADDRRDPRGLRVSLRRDRQAGRHRHVEQAPAGTRILQGLRVPVPGLRPHRADPQAARAGRPAPVSSRPSRGTSSISCRRSCKRNFRRSRSNWATGGA